MEGCCRHRCVHWLMIVSGCMTHLKNHFATEALSVLEEGGELRVEGVGGGALQEPRESSLGALVLFIGHCNCF